MSHRLRRADDPVRGGERALASAGQTFLNDANGRRPVFGGTRKFQEDPHWHDCILFYEYFYGDNGAGIGASHQTGWTGIVAKLIELLGYLDPDMFLETPDFLAVSASASPASRGSEVPR